MKMDDEEKSIDLHQVVHTDSSNEVPMNEGPREKLIQTAIAFLQNPKVKGSPLSQKKTFLASKGLTPEEVKIALEQAASVNVDTRVDSNGYHLASNVHNMVQPFSVPMSPFAKFRGFCTMILVTSGTVYGLYHFAKKYLIPYIYGLPTDEERLHNLEKQMTDFQLNINETMAQLQHTLRDLQNTLQQICKKQDVIAQPQIQTNIDSQFKDLRTEITSLKGLLLNKHQFPAAPAINRIIPAWQMDTSGGAEVLNGNDSVIDVQEKNGEPEPSSC